MLSALGGAVSWTAPRSLLQLVQLVPETEDEVSAVCGAVSLLVCRHVITVALGVQPGQPGHAGQSPGHAEQPPQLRCLPKACPGACPLYPAVPTVPGVAPGEPLLRGRRQPHGAGRRRQHADRTPGPGPSTGTGPSPGTGTGPFPLALAPTRIWALSKPWPKPKPSPNPNPNPSLGPDPDPDLGPSQAGASGCAAGGLYILASTRWP